MGLGDSDPFVLRALDGSQRLAGDHPLPALLHEAFTDVEITWKASPGHHDIKLIIDPEHQVRDPNRSNDIALFIIEVLSLPYLPYGGKHGRQ